jgi:hypothetical protein
MSTSCIRFAAHTLCPFRLYLRRRPSESCAYRSTEGDDKAYDVLRSKHVDLYTDSHRCAAPYSREIRPRSFFVRSSTLALVSSDHRRNGVYRIFHIILLHRAEYSVSQLMLLSDIWHNFGCLYCLRVHQRKCILCHAER